MGLVFIVVVVGLVGVVGCVIYVLLFVDVVVDLLLDGWYVVAWCTACHMNCVFVFVFGCNVFVLLRVCYMVVDCLLCVIGGLL